jgi:hypothetical protein
VNASATNMEVDSAHVVGAAPYGKLVASSLTAGNFSIAVTPYNPNLCTPRGVEIVEKAKITSSELIAAAIREPPRSVSPSRGRPNMLQRYTHRSGSVSGPRTRSPARTRPRSPSPMAAGGPYKAFSSLGAALATSPPHGDGQAMGRLPPLGAIQFAVTKFLATGSQVP